MLNETSAETAPPWLTLIGIGEDGLAGLSQKAMKALDGARWIAGGARHLALIGPRPAPAYAWPSPLEDGIAEVLARRGQPVAVLASGDPFCFGIGATLARLLPMSEIASIPMPSAFALAGNRLGWALQDCACISLHGRPLEGLVVHLQRGRRILALSWDATTPEKVARLLAARGLGASRLTVCEAMGGPRERLRQASAKGFALSGIDPLNTLAIEIAGGAGAQFTSSASGLHDWAFANDGQITRREIRAMAIAALEPGYGEILWDVGAGSGSIAIAWSHADPAGTAYAIEPAPTRAGFARANAMAHGASKLQVIEAAAPEAFALLPDPDAIFIGGGATQPGVMETAISRLKPGGRLVANAVTLETQALLAALHGARGGLMTSIQLAHAKAVGRFRGWSAAMPVTQWAYRKPFDEPSRQEWP